MRGAGKRVLWGGEIVTEEGSSGLNQSVGVWRGKYGIWNY